LLRRVSEMPICPYCGKYHKKSHHRRHMRSCVGGTGYAYEHLQRSKGGSKMSKKIQEKKRQEKFKRIQALLGVTEEKRGGG